jgi:hypothetical protein
MTLRPLSLIGVVFVAWVTSLGVVPTLASRSVVLPPPLPITDVPPQPPDAPAEITNDDCLMCHSDAEAKAEDGRSIAVDGSRFAKSVHGLMEMSCTTCHADLEGKELPHEAKLAKVDCSMCHEDVVKEYETSVHAVARRADSTVVAATCVNCHTAHETQPVSTDAWRIDLPTECGTCHLDRIKTYRDTFHGQITALGFERVAKCSDCHAAHAIHPKEDPRSLVSAGKIVSTCQQCHADATPGFAQYDPHADKDNVERNPELYYASRFMHWLLIGVFGFFGIHALLWLPRSAMERRRHHAPHSAPAPTPEPTPEPKDDEQP